MTVEALLRPGARRVLAVLAATLALASLGWAQGMYYKEVRKDGRIYVFNDAKKAEAFEKSGETGTGLSRPGVGPNGETVVADSEHALELFFFKHGIAQVVERPKPPALKIEWRDGKTRITTDKAYLEVSNRVQVRYTHDLPYESVTLPGTRKAGDSRGSFRIRRAKFKLEGWFYKPELTYEVQTNWPAITGSNPGAFLEDANIGWDISKKGTFKVLFGQNKVAFGHQELISSGNQVFVDRAEVSNQFARGRDVGLSVIGVLGNNRIEYRAGVYNGNGLTRTVNDKDQFQYNARVMWQITGGQSLKQRAWVSGPLYSEGDFESTDKPIVWLAGNFEKNDFHRTTSSVDLKDTIYGLDAGMKYKGVYLTAECYIRERTPETGVKFNSDGWFAQASYLIGKKRQWEIAGRYGRFEPSSLVSAERSELRFGANYYYSRHGLKVQADYGRLGTEARTGNTENNELRLQTQFIF